MRLPRTTRPAPPPVRAAQLDPDLDAALLDYCRREGRTISAALRELLALGLRARGAVGASARRQREREAVRQAKRELLSAVARATLRD